MLYLCTDYGFEGPYVGQMKAVAAEMAPNCLVIDLIHNLPKFNPAAASYLLASIVQRLPRKSIVVAVVDPGVGSDRGAIVLHADDRWIIGPDNFLLNVIAKQSSDVCFYRITYQPENISMSFHGRDIFMPVAMRIFQESLDESVFQVMVPPNLNFIPDEKAEIIYVDSFGNLMTGLRADLHLDISTILFKGMHINRACTFSTAGKGEPLFYENSQNLLEIAVNCGSAQQYFAAQIGDAVLI